MPTTTVKVPDTFGPNSEESLLASSKLDKFPEEEIKTTTATLPVPLITPRTDFAIRQANHLVERICRDHGVEAKKYTFSKCLVGQEDEIAVMSTAKHLSVLRLAEYLHKRGQIERDYATSIQKLNRQLVQTGDTDERLGQLIVMGEKTAAGHLDWARKISEERIIEELKTLCGENEEQRKYLMSELKKYRGIWSKAVGAFEKVRKNRDKALKAADSAQLALDTAVSRGNSSKSTLMRLQEDVYQKSNRAQISREEYNRAMAALTQRQNEIFKEQIPQCLEGFEKMERARIGAVRASLISLAQIHLAVADVEIESGQRWLKSLVSLGVDDEIELFVQSIEERSIGRKILEDEFDCNNEEGVEEGEVKKEPLKQQTDNFNESTTSFSPQNNSSNSLYSCNLTNSENDLLKLSNGIEDISDSTILKERLDKLEELQTKLGQQLEALQRMEQAYTAQIQQTGETYNEATLAAVKTSMKGISREIEENSNIIVLIEEKLRSAKLPGTNNTSNSGAKVLDRANPLSSILEELNKLDQRRSAQVKLTSTNIIPSKQQATTHQQPTEKKKSLSRSFEDILKSGDQVLLEAEEEVASPKATGLKLPGAQWTSAAITKSNEDIRSAETNGDYFCAEEAEEEEVYGGESKTSVGIKQDNQTTKTQTQAQAQSPRRKSFSQSTPNTSANSQLVPQNSCELFRVQALYNFIGRKETDELDLRTGEILSIFDANGEWWEAENEAGARGYIPFNYVIRI